LRLTERRGFVRDFGFVILMGVCVVALYHLARGDAATMVTAFLRRVHAMGQP